jgi:6-phosphofructokinase 1
MTRRSAAVVVFHAALTGLPIPSSCFTSPAVAFRRGFPIESVAEPEECYLDEEGAADCLSSAGFELQDNTNGDSSFMMVTQVFVAQVESLRGSFPSYEEIGQETSGSNMIKYHKRRRREKILLTPDETENTHVANMEYNQLIDPNEVVLVDTVRKPGLLSVSRAFPRAGPRKFLHFDPSQVNAAIVTCGGLCPGLNNVIRELVHSLYYLYGANKVYGIRGGFHGFAMENPDYDPVLLTNEIVENIHHEGGTILRSSRGGFDIDKIIDFLKGRDISQLYIIGGDGTHRGAYAIHEECVNRGLNIAIAGIPKTIDNDVDYIDRSFGFQSAVEAAQGGIRTGKTEAMCNVPNGIGIVKLMGRSAGFLAVYAALGSGDVDLVLVPEVPIVLEGPDGILPFLRQRVKEQKYAVVVLAEGAGEELVGVSEELDAGGNRARPKIGKFITDAIAAHFKEHDQEATIKYIDPSYTVRSVPANGADSLYCMQLAQNAVHGAMAGLTGFSVGLVNKSVVYLPIPQLVASSPRSMESDGTAWERVLAMTGQPNTARPRKRNNEMEGDFPSLSEPSAI